MGTEALKTIKTEGMTAKQFISVLTLVLLGTLTYGQKIEYSTDQLREYKSGSEMQLKVPYYRMPKIPEDIHSFVELKSKISNIQDWPKWRNGFGDYKDDYFLGHDLDNKLIINKKKPHFEIYDDRLELANIGSNKKMVIWFTDLRDQDLKVIKLRIYKDTEEQSVLELKNMWFDYNVDWFADYLYAIKFFLYEKPLIDKTNDSIKVADSIHFSTLAAKYREVEIKPTVTEDQRKYIVQANSFAKDKQFTEALEAYKKAIELDPVAYPQAYYNMALLYAGNQNFEMAVRNMKKYLLLLPDAPDARAAQDKIYEWER